jgi:hypothetical protein
MWPSRIKLLALPSRPDDEWHSGKARTHVQLSSDSIDRSRPSSSQALLLAATAAKREAGAAAVHADGHGIDGGNQNVPALR